MSFTDAQLAYAAKCANDHAEYLLKEGIARNANLAAEMMAEWARTHPGFTSMEYGYAVHAAASDCKRNPSGSFYNSCTHGRIALSQRGKDLMSLYRGEVQHCIAAKRAGHKYPNPDGRPLFNYMKELLARKGFTPLPYEDRKFSKSWKLTGKLYVAACAAIKAGDFCTNDKALSRARGEIALYISSLEGNQTMCKTPTPETPIDSEDSIQARANKLADSIEAVKHRTLEVAGTHGMQRIKDILTHFGVGNISGLPLNKVGAYCYKLEKLALELPPSEVALKAAQALTQCHSYSGRESLETRDRILFEAGREYQRKY